MRPYIAILFTLALCGCDWELDDDNDYEYQEVNYVDLGLPSGTLWADRNVGSHTAADPGYYFAWGEVDEKDAYLWQSYEWIERGHSAWQHIDKYQIEDGNFDGIWYCGGAFVGDGVYRLDPDDDAATDYLGYRWKTPSPSQMDELRQHCTWMWTTDYKGSGMPGYVVESNARGNYNSIFLPAGGYADGSRIREEGKRGAYWTSELEDECSLCAYSLIFYMGIEDITNKERYYGLNIRAVSY